jgi:clan AA aspartic protease (TIGR02281 family)
MKKFVVAGFLLVSGLAFAQNDAVTSAFLYNKDGEYDKAKDEIDKAVLHEKTKEKAKTWYFRGMIYENILNSKNAKFTSLAPDAAKQTYDSYTKAISLSSKGDEYHDNSVAKVDLLWGTFLNDGIAKYQAGVAKLKEEKKEEAVKQFQESIASYEISQLIKPTDTTAFVYTLYSAESMADYEKVRQVTYKLVSMGRKSPEMFISLSRQAKNADKKDSALAHVVAGRAFYPNNKSLALEELQLYFDLGKGNQAKSKLEETVKLDSTNAALFAILGNLYDTEAADVKRPAKERDASKQQALAAYKKALKLDSNNLESSFNLGVYYFNRGVEIIRKLDKIDFNEFQKLGKKIESDAIIEFKQALPFFEACYKVDPYDKGVCNSLKNTYIRLKRNADADRIPDCERTKPVGNEIPLTPKNGIFELVSYINDVEFKVYFDSGASDVSISLTEAMHMLKQGKMTKSDIVGQTNYSDANGEISEGTKVILRKVRIGDFELSNVEASVVHNLNAPILLGQSVLKRFKKFEVDNERKVLILYK